MDLKLKKLFERTRPTMESLDRLTDTLMNDIVAGILRKESHLLTDLTPRERRTASLGLLSDTLHQKRVWYVTASTLLTPFRIYHMKSALGEGNTSIMTKSRREGARGRIVIWSPDVLRDHLADAGAPPFPDFLIIDDAEYLGHSNAGVVLEETLLCLPPSLPVVLLMSSVSNGPELAQWLEKSRRIPCRLVALGPSPTPVVAAFISSGWDLIPLLENKGLTGKVKRFLKETSPFPNVHSAAFIRRLVSILREENLVPALVLMPSELDCDAATAACEPVFKEIGDALTEPRVAASLDRYPFLKEHPLLSKSLMRKAAPLHAGHHPLWSEWVERFIQPGYLDIVFATADAAESMTASIRSAVLCTSSGSIDGRGLRPLSLWEMHRILEQLGRNESNEAPCIAIAHTRETDPVHLKGLLLAPARHVSSVFRCSFPVVLSLFSQTADPESFLERSLSVLQTPDEGESARLESLTAELDEMLPEAQCVRNIETIRLLINLRYRLILRRDELTGGRQGKPLRGWEKDRMEEERDYLSQVLSQFPCEGCEHLPFCHKRGYRKLRVLLDEYCKIRNRVIRDLPGLKIDFERYAQCLTDFGMVGPDQRLTRTGILAHRTGLRIPQTLVEVLRHGLLLSSDLDRSLALMGGFVERPGLDHSPRTEFLAEEIDELRPKYMAMEPVLRSTTERMLRWGILAPRPSIEQSAALLALRRGMNAQTLAEKGGISIGALTRLAQNAEYLIERVRSIETEKE